MWMVPDTDRLNNFEHWMLKVHLKSLNITCRGCQYYSLTDPTLPRRAQQQDSSPLGLEEMRLTGEGQCQCKISLPTQVYMFSIRRSRLYTSVCTIHVSMSCVAYRCTDPGP